MFIWYAGLYLHYTSDRKEIMQKFPLLREIVISEVIYYYVIVMKILSLQKNNDPRNREEEIPLLLFIP